MRHTTSLLRTHPKESAPFQRTADRWYSEKRLGGLSRFAVAITILNILGHTFLGFEQAWIVPFVAIGTAYLTDLLAETVDAALTGRRRRYSGSAINFIRFLLPAHISGLAIGMLLYSPDNIAAVAFAVSVAIGSKYVLRAPLDGQHLNQPKTTHFLNPSNFGIAATLVLFPTVGIAPPYQFTENTYGFVDYLIPFIVIGTGSYLNTKATGRIPLILAWLLAFATQAIVRALFNETPILSGLVPMTGFAFILFTFYMITDPATSPAKLSNQIGFAAAVAIAYGMLMQLHIVFGLFYALALVTGARGCLLWMVALRRHPNAPVASTRSSELNPAE